MIFRFWKKLGQAAFYFSIPLLHLYLRSSKRTRVLIVSEGRALLVKGWLGSGKWILPGGGRHFRESPSDGVVRELMEETGIILSPEKLTDLGEADFARYGLRFKYQQFITELPAIIKPKLRKLEIVDAAWVPLEEINDGIAERDVIALLQKWKASQ